jgi:phosphoribosylformimino-5-aminoimidazole carboxamide ribotide isomerase
MPKLPFRVIPALDLKRGRAVHAVAGRRAYYEPLRSLLHPDADPIGIARALRDKLGFLTLYLADLDAIEGSPPDVALYRALLNLRLHLWIDAGTRSVVSLASMLELDAATCTIVVGLETIGGPGALAEILGRTGPERIIFSVDLCDERPRMAPEHSWKTVDAAGVALEVVRLGVRELLLIDLARVGTGRGLGTEGLVEQIRAASPGVALCVGGGISSIEEVLRLSGAHVSGVLISSALHDGRIGTRELARLAVGDEPHRVL